MSKMKSTLAATFLTLVLVVPALAGNIGTPGATPPPPPPPPICESISSAELVNFLLTVLSFI